MSQLRDLPDKPKVLIFRNELLPASETFIKAQAGAMESFLPKFIGVHAAQRPISLPSLPTLVDSTSTLTGKIRRRAFWRTGFAPGFYRDLEALHPAILHAHFALDGAAALPIARRLNLPLIVTLHGYDITSSDKTHRCSPEGKLYLHTRERLWSEASIFLCISQFLYDVALSQGFPEKKLRLHYTGTDLRMFAAESQPRDPNLILFVGRLVEKKGFPYLLDALKAVCLHRPSAHIVAIGGGPLEHQLQSSAMAKGLPCTFLGPQPVEEVRRYMARARIFCAPSVKAESGDSEGLGMVFIEAQAIGTPVVSFHHGGIPEVVRHGETGLLAPEGDVQALATHLVHLLSDNQTWHRYSTQGRLWVQQQFDLSRQTARLESIYREVLHTAHSGCSTSR